MTSLLRKFASAVALVALSATIASGQIASSSGGVNGTNISVGGAALNDPGLTINNSSLGEGCGQFGASSLLCGSGSAFSLTWAGSGRWSINAGGNAINALVGATIQSTGGAIPTATCSGGSTGVTVAAGSTNNRGSITTSSVASTNCTLTWSAAGTWNQAPFCVFQSHSAVVAGLNDGTCGTSTCIFNFTSATSQVVDYICM